MFTNQKGETLSKIINLKKSRRANNSKIGSSFQQLYDLLSRKQNGIDMPELHHKSAPKTRHSKDKTDSKLHINIKYEN
jgi:hypothetical protein